MDSRGILGIVERALLESFLCHPCLFGLPKTLTVAPAEAAGPPGDVRPSGTAGLSALGMDLKNRNEPIKHGPRSISYYNPNFDLDRKHV